MVQNGNGDGSREGKDIRSAYTTRTMSPLDWEIRIANMRESLMTQATKIAQLKKEVDRLSVIIDESDSEHGMTLDMLANAEGVLKAIKKIALLNEDRGEMLMILRLVDRYFADPKRE
jgi:hypothetical protein